MQIHSTTSTIHTDEDKVSPRREEEITPINLHMAENEINKRQIETDIANKTLQARVIKDVISKTNQENTEENRQLLMELEKEIRELKLKNEELNLRLSRVSTESSNKHHVFMKHIIPIKTIDLKLYNTAEHAGAIKCIEPLQDLEMFVIGDRDGNLSFFKFILFEKFKTINLHKKAIKDILYMNDGKTIYSGGLEGYLVCTDIETFSCRSLQGNEGPISAITNPLNGLSLFTANNRRITEWDIVNNKLLSSFDAHDDKITGLLYIHQRDIIISSSRDKNIKIWNPITKECLGCLEGHLDGIKAITYGYVKQHLNIVSVGRDSVITFWDLDDKDYTKSFRMKSPAKDVFYLGDKKCFVTVHADRKFYVWNTEKEESRLFYPDNLNFNGYNTGCYMDDGYSIILGTQDGSLQLWHGNN